MARVVFTQNLQRHVDCPETFAVGETVKAVLENVFAARPLLRGYILDDQGCLRHHMMIFVDNEPVRDRSCLSDPVAPDSEIYVLQALSGGQADRNVYGS